MAISNCLFINHLRKFARIFSLVYTCKVWCKTTQLLIAEPVCDLKPQRQETVKGAC